MSRKLSEEEKIAREALGRIRAWLKQEGGLGPGRGSPRLAIKFCGGCNPEVERGTIAQMLRHFLGADVLWSSPEEETDLLVVIEGCSTACAARPEVTGKTRGVLHVAGKTVSPLQGGFAMDPRKS